MSYSGPNLSGSNYIFQVKKEKKYATWRIKLALLKNNRETFNRVEKNADTIIATLPHVQNCEDCFNSEICWFIDQISKANG